jgi:hypothetical protein
MILAATTFLLDAFHVPARVNWVSLGFALVAAAFIAA